MKHQSDINESNEIAERERTETTREYNDTRPGMDEFLHLRAGYRQRTSNRSTTIHRETVPRVPELPPGPYMQLARRAGGPYIRYRIGDEVVEIHTKRFEMKRIRFKGIDGMKIEPESLYDREWVRVFGKVFQVPKQGR